MLLFRKNKPKSTNICELYIMFVRLFVKRDLKIHSNNIK